MNSSDSICLLRLSALGDVTHVLPVIQRLRVAKPNCSITWVIGELEAKLLAPIDNVNLVVYRKKDGLRGLRDLRRKLTRSFDALLLMQLSFRAGIVSRAIQARRRIGFSTSRSRELHGAFVNERCSNSDAVHVADVLQGFLDPLGVPRSPMRWDFPLSDDATQVARQWVRSEKTMVISPCASHQLRNWSAPRYAAVIDYAQQKFKLHTLLVGGQSVTERQMEIQILKATKTRCDSIVGKDTLPQLAATLQRAAIVLSPDSGPAHIANAVGTDVIGLYAATDPNRSGPYNSISWCVNRYQQALEKFETHSPERVRKWGHKVERPGVMDLISVDAVIERLDAYAVSRGWS